MCGRVGRVFFFFNKIYHAVGWLRSIRGCLVGHHIDWKIRSTEREGKRERERERERWLWVSNMGLCFCGRVCIFVRAQACVVYNFVQSRWVCVCLCEGAHEHV